MRLLHLRLRNFRQHADSEIVFRTGLTGIIGPNGAGKSTILEAIAWCVYGAQAARGTNDTIRFSRAAPRSRVEVELGFALAGHEYRVVRTLSHAEAFLDGGAAPVATGLGGVSAYLQSRIGMTREEFFNTYFTGQKELQFLATMGPADRGRFLSQVLGFERLRRAQELSRARRAELRSEIRGLRAVLGDVEALSAARLAAERRMTAALGALSAARTAMAEADAALKVLAPRWEAAQAARERARELAHVVEAAATEAEGARREAGRAATELEAVAEAEASLAPLRSTLEALPSAAEACERLAELARKDERRRALSAQAAELEAERVQGAERVGTLESAPELERKYAAELERFRADRAEKEAALDAKKTGWLADRQDAFTKLQAYRERARELKEQIKQIEELGPEGTCPTCGRPVGDDFERLLEELTEQWASLVQDGKWWSSRHEQLEARPAEVTELEAEVRRLGEAVDDRSKKHVRCQGAVQELEGLRAEHGRRVERLEALRSELAALPAGYDAGEHRAAEARLRELRALETKAARLEEAAGRRGALERTRADAEKRAVDAEGRGRAAGAEREALGYSEEAFEGMRGEQEAAVERHRGCELRETALRGEVNTAEQALQQAQRAEAEYHERAKEVGERETELRYHEELDLAYGELRAELNDQVRPELSEIASAFLAQLTDGRYTSMEIDEAYNLMVLDEGEEKPVISGGEEDIANLVLRLSLSQMIAERSGHPLSLLILDEVFGSLDVARRDNVVQLLHHLEDRFEQVILITHIEGIRESLDQVLRVEYDERAGTSRVREELMGGGDYPEAPMAAD
jgi:DNA repair protein SbcC/Rad50